MTFGCKVPRVIKTILCCLFAATITAQPVFQKKIDGLELAEGLALMPDGGYVMAGLQGNCIQIIRLDANGSALWMRQVCLANESDDISFSVLHLVADKVVSGAFYLGFRKGAFSSSPENLLNLMKFDANGELLWETQLRPEKRYGAQLPGSQLAATPTGAMWAVLATGFTDALPDYNQALVFKVNASGQPLLRRFFLTNDPATANGIMAKNDKEIYVYGALGNAIKDGFLVKINEQGEAIWSNRYAGLHFIQDGGFFANGDLMLMAEQEGAFALARIAADGSVVWAVKFTNGLSLFHCSVAADGGILLAARKVNEPFMILKINSSMNETEWAITYEACTQYHFTALNAVPDGGLVFTQSAVVGTPKTRLIKANSLGQLSPECPFWELPKPALAPISVTTTPLQFTSSGTLTEGVEHVFELSETNIEIQDCCPTEYPDARFVLPDSVCVESAFSLISTGNSCADEWRWEIPDALPREAQGIEFQNVIFKKEGDYLVKLTETIGDCSDTISGFLHVVEPLQLEVFSFFDTVLCPDAPFEVQPDLTGLDTWIWGDGDTAATLFFDLPVSGTFRLNAQHGLCAIVDSFRIQLGNCGPTRVFTPNAFSPNDDGGNDVWEIFMQAGVTPLSCQIFDRWGSLCYASKTNEMPRWDGMMNGRQLLSGVYVWQFRLRNPEGNEEVLSGDLLLVR